MYAVPVLVPTLLQWAAMIEDEIDLDTVAAEIRHLAWDTTMRLDNLVTRVRNAGIAAGTGCGCHFRSRCSYHEGWYDAVNMIEEELDNAAKNG
jgi:hypothetical protein